MNAKHKAMKNSIPATKGGLTAEESKAGALRRIRQDVSKNPFSGHEAAIQGMREALRKNRK